MKLPDVRRRAARTLEIARTHPRRMRALATVLIIVVVAASFAGPFLFQDAAGRHLSAWNDGRQDLSHARSEIGSVAEGRGGTVGALATSAYLVDGAGDPSDLALFVFGAERPYSPGEAQAILAFVEAGGVLVLANDVSNGNALARPLGITFADRTILDQGNAYKNKPQLVQVDVPMGARDYRVLMNSPGYMIVHDDARDVNVLAWSSDESYVDLDGDGRIDMEDQAQAYPLVAEATHGAGRVLVVADAGLFTNGMLGITSHENRDFVRALAQDVLSDRAHVLIDESRHAPPPAAAAGNAGLRFLVTVTSAPVVNLVIAGLAIAGVIAAVILKRDTEDWSVHAFDVGHEVPAPRTLAPDPDRLRLLAQRAISENFNIPVEYLQSAPFDELVRLTGDKELVAVATGKERAHASAALYAKLTAGTQTPTLTPQEA